MSTARPAVTALGCSTLGFAALGLAVLAAAGPAPATAASISGRVTYIGRLPEPVYVFESGQEQAILAVDGQRGLGGAVVFVDAPAAAAETHAPEATINQRNWWFSPAIVAVRAGQPVRFTNDDPSNHNVRSSTGVPANRFSAYTGTGQPYVHRFRTNRDASPVMLTCDIHAWMMAWIYVFDHSYFTQSDRSGRYTIANLPAGRYQFSIRHAPSGLSRDATVVVQSGRDTTIDVVFDTPDLRLPQR